MFDCRADDIGFTRDKPVAVVKPLWSADDSPHGPHLCIYITLATRGYVFYVLSFSE